MKHGLFLPKLVFTTSLLLASVSQSASAITIDLNFLGGLSLTQQDVFSQAELFWESVLIGYQPGISIPSVTIDAEGTAIDGVGGILGSAGPNSITNQSGYFLPTMGDMSFDTADLSNLETSGFLEDVILHEMAHVLGFGTLWTQNGVYKLDGLGQYTGANALAMWQTEFNQPGAAYIPVELDGGVGTANGHWNENNGGLGLTGITDGNGKDMRDELMTGWLNTPTFISNTTKMSFMDIGYDVAIVPAPAAFWLFVSGFLGVIGLARCKKHKRLPQGNNYRSA